jgi:hypothetical protein
MSLVVVFCKSALTYKWDIGLPAAAQTGKAEASTVMAGFVPANHV